MKSNGMLLALALALCTLAASAQTPPPNDNYANRTVLTGTDITFSGTLAGATAEDTNELGAIDPFNFDPVTNYRSIWWTWTAPASTGLTLELLGFQGHESGRSPELVVYSATNGATSPVGLVLPGVSLPLGIVAVGSTLSLPVTAGSQYQLQLIAEDPDSCSFRLVATNTPFIEQQPASETVYSNASVVFYVVYAGTNQSAYTFQWQFNGTNLPDETVPMIVRTNIDSSMAGAYSVIVSNAVGYVVSQPAILTVSKSNYPATLAITGYHSNSLTFNLNGESGRGYRLLSSTNLVDWIPEINFPLPFDTYPSYDVIFNTNSPLPITVTNASARKFFRVTPYIIDNPAAEICINNLRQIQIAKFLWRRDYNLSYVSYPSDADIQPYFPHYILPVCPLDSDQSFDTSYNIFGYTFQRIPVCEIVPTNHLLEELR